MTLVLTERAPMTGSSLSLLVGRERELEVLGQLRAQVMRNQGAVVLVSGDGGIGKTRLVQELAQSVRESGWQVMMGRAYALEAGIPYAPFADACEASIAALDSNVLLRLTRGDRTMLTALAPSLAANATADARGNGSTAAEQHARLHAGVLQLLARMAERQPLLLVLENLQWADTTSLELLHFLARQVGSHRVMLVATWNETERELPEALRAMARSLRSLGVSRELPLAPLTPLALEQLIAQRFDVDSASTGSFVSTLHEATRGNPFFVEQILEDLIARGTLRRIANVWVGWHLDAVTLPRSVRDVLQARLDRLSAGARRVADIVSVGGTAIAHDVVRNTLDVRVDEFDDRTGGDGTEVTDLLAALDELRLQGIIVESLEGSRVAYDVAHPLLRQALTDAMGLARERTLHARIATALEQVSGDRAERMAEAIAVHWRLADPQVNARRAVHWLLLAGRQAVDRLAHREAAITFRAALDRADEYPELVDASVVPVLLDELSKLYRRLGEYQQTVAMCTRARDLADVEHNDEAVAVAERRLGIALDGLGHRAEAVRHYDAGIARAERAGNLTLITRLRLAKGDALQALGAPAEARQEIALALDLAEQSGDDTLLARAHRIMLVLHTWSGPAHRAWAHARSAVELAERTGARNLAWSAHWSTAVLAGLTSNTSALQYHLSQATRLADELHSPMLQLRTAEITIEYAAGIGEWDRALVEGERAIATARDFDQTSMLARLLYWVGGVYLQRGEIGEAQRLFDESWRVSGADGQSPERLREVHGILPAMVARVMWLGAIGEHARAIELGREATAMADRTGYVAWAVYRLLPSIAESAMALNDRPTLVAMRDRLQRDSATLSHAIGRGWVALIDGELARQDLRVDEAISLLQTAIGTLEAVPFPFDAARARVRLARTLQQHGDVDEAAREARAALHVFEQVGARPAIDDARALLRSLGARVPTRRTTPGFDGLTGRELEIVRLVARRLSNKEVGAQLDISARTVGTHLANIFDKVGVRDRTALGDLAREQGLHRG